MCGIVGYVGPKQAEGVVIEGLRRLEYRGYDSAGIALVHDGSIASQKRAGKLANLDKALAEHPLPESSTGIGHTRWATHGAPNDRNAHPHLGATGRVALVHNGIIENFAALRAELERAGHEMTSETDTEIAAHLLEARLAEGGNLTEAMQHVCGRLHGAFTLVAIDGQDPDRVVAARRNSPLVVGVGDGENFLASDVAAFIEHTRDALELGQDQVVTITREGVEVTDFAGRPAEAHAVPRRLGPLGRREGRLRLVHAQGDPRAAARRSPTRCSAATTRPARSSSTSCGSARTSCAASTRSS